MQAYSFKCGTKIECRLLFIGKLDILIPPYQIANVGSTVKFICLSDEETIWTFESGALPDNVIPFYDMFSNPYITITSVQLSNAGHYQCEVNDLSEKIIFYAEGELQVKSMLHKIKYVLGRSIF